MRRLLAAAALSAGLAVTVVTPAADACTVEGCVRGVCNLARDCRLGLGCYDVLGAVICT